MVERSTESLIISSSNLETKVCRGISQCSTVPERDVNETETRPRLESRDRDGLETLKNVRDRDYSPGTSRQSHISYNRPVVSRDAIQYCITKTECYPLMGSALVNDKVYSHDSRGTGCAVAAAELL